MTCIVSGSLVSITNEPLINTEIYIQSTDGIRALGSRTILPKAKKYISDDTGSVVMELEPGSYRMFWIQNNKVNSIPVSVPDSPTALLSDLLNEVEYPVRGTAGLQVELRNNGGDIEWRYEGDPWSLLIPNDELSVPSDMTVEVSIGNVTEGESASVTNTGTDRNVVLDFVLPKGERGEKGEDGEQGPQGIQGVPGQQGIQGPPGQQGIQGLPGEPGRDGIDGIDGKDGKSFTVDAIGNTNDRSLYNSEDIGFSFLDIDEGELFFRVDPTGWSVAIPFGKGEKGEDGEQGERGPQGLQGIQGVKGDDGSIIHYGSGVPSSGLGEINDWYIRDNASRTLYQKTGASVWTGRGDLVGPQGQQGEQGLQGIQGPPGNDGQSGPPGDDGSKIHYVTDVPSSSLGDEGDWAIRNDSDRSLYEKTSSNNWTLRTTLRGPQGEQGLQGEPGTGGGSGTGNDGADGEDGSVIHYVSGSPSNALGKVGDWAISDDSDVSMYEKTGETTWTKRQELKGPQGSQGEQGIQGIQGPPGEDGSDGNPGSDGADGSVIHYISGSPVNSLGKIGDWAIRDNAERTLYEKTGATTWTSRGDLRGPQGQQGTQGTQGVQGDQGIPGNDGSDGSVIHYVSSAPDGGLGEIGDWAIRDDTDSSLYEKTGASSWTLRNTLRGPQGSQGTQGLPGDNGSPGTPGADGSQIHYVTAAPANELGEIGDWAIRNDADRSLYEKTGSTTWTQRGDLRGPQGTQGIQGIAGPKGDSPTVIVVDTEAELPGSPDPDTFYVVRAL